MSETHPIESVAVMNQLPTSDTVTGESPLVMASLRDTDKASPSEHSGVIVKEHALLGHLVIRGNASDADFNAAFEQVFGTKLPSKLQCVYLDTLSVRWISPDEWLVICASESAFELENKLREVATGHFAVINVSGGQTLITLSGRHAREVLMKSTSYDVHDVAFPIGKVVTSVFAKTQAVIARKEDDVWELVVRRSFAHYVWLWLQNSCAEFSPKFDI